MMQDRIVVGRTERVPRRASGRRGQSGSAYMVAVLAMVVLGGMGSIPGAIAGAILLCAGPALLRVWFPEFQDYRLLVFGALMVIIMIYRPQGLFGSSRLRAQLAAKENE